MTYMITRWALGPQPTLDLSDSDYAELLKARGHLLVALALEEKFDLLVANYEEFENDVLAFSLTRMIRSDLSWSGMVGDRLQLTRRLANLLTTGRLYSGQAKHDIARQYGRTLAAEFDGWLGDERAACIGFRVVEQLRNALQHRHLPISGLTYSAHRIADTPHGWFQHGLFLKLDTAELLADTRGDRSVLDEVAALPDESVDLILFIRQYVEGIARVQERLRDAIKADVRAADATYRAHVARWLSEADGNPIGVSIDQKRPTEQFPQLRFTLNLHAVERRDELARRNQGLRHLSRLFVSGAAKSSPLWLAT